MAVLERFIKYVQYDTQSEDGKDCLPSTEKQWDLAKELVCELKEIGARDVVLSDQCYVYATIPATVQSEVPVIGFIAHMDTATEMSGRNVRPRVIKDYDGSDIILNEELGIVLSPKDFSSLEENIGQDLVVTDGTTLLGADDKAGIAEIMEMTPPKIVEEGEVPEEPVSPNVVRNAAVGGIAGFLAVCGVICLLTVMNDTIKDEEDIEKYLGVSVLAAIPVHTSENGSSKAGKQSEKRKSRKKNK